LPEGHFGIRNRPGGDDLAGTDGTLPLLQRSYLVSGGTAKEEPRDVHHVESTLRKLK
jgi:hypothetical protein